MHGHDCATDWRHFDFACHRISSFGDVGSTHGFHGSQTQIGMEKKGQKDPVLRDERYARSTCNLWHKYENRLRKLTTTAAGQWAHVACPIECPLISNVKGAPCGTWISLYAKVQLRSFFVSSRCRDLLSSESKFWIWVWVSALGKNKEKYL